MVKKTTKSIYIKLNDTDRLILSSFCSFANCLGTFLGSAYEVVVHSFGEKDRYIQTIVNGGLSGRTIDDELTDRVVTVVDQLELRIRHGDPAYYMSFGFDLNGKKVKSASIAILGSEKRLIGMLCVNCYLETPLVEIIRDFTLPAYLDVPIVSLPLNDTSRYDTAMRGQILKVRDEVMKDPAVPAKFKRKEIVRRLNDYGIFKVKDAIQICADTLGITIATIYMHLRNLENNGL